jgi:hypothetical protein
LLRSSSAQVELGISLQDIREYVLLECNVLLGEETIDHLPPSADAVKRTRNNEGQEYERGPQKSYVKSAFVDILYLRDVSQGGHVVCTTMKGKVGDLS